MKIIKTLLISLAMLSTGINYCHGQVIEDEFFDVGIDPRGKSQLCNSILSVSSGYEWFLQKKADGGYKGNTYSETIDGFTVKPTYARRLWSDKDGNLVINIVDSQDGVDYLVINGNKLETKALQKEFLKGLSSSAYLYDFSYVDAFRDEYYTWVWADAQIVSNNLMRRHAYYFFCWNNDRIQDGFSGYKIYDEEEGQFVISRGGLFYLTSDGSKLSYHCFGETKWEYINGDKIVCFDITPVYVQTGFDGYAVVGHYEKTNNISRPVLTFIEINGGKILTEKKYPAGAFSLSRYSRYDSGRRRFYLTRESRGYGAIVEYVDVNSIVDSDAMKSFSQLSLAGKEVVSLLDMLKYDYEKMLEHEDKIIVDRYGKQILAFEEISPVSKRFVQWLKTSKGGTGFEDIYHMMAQKGDPLHAIKIAKATGYSQEFLKTLCREAIESDYHYKYEKLVKEILNN